ncbi:MULTISPECIES: chemotaxis-specific protein-glutamate methyltransferase CheB [Legionella]|uniref:Protein-glutamate methylesterase/protein-glutamine glutaminase n=1 Tax=Legionella septentrionalis TaxID=2498109 RepID=A0A433JKJ3_9GAMM|nr:MULTISPECIES: chemotaxis-specific protein-glutamate methyltransferase CheB [Legionella]MCP0914156.1 chemotaxis-specific protein-glutamate methyltransferase CheB [Legionella sp. 27cVA30]RUQ89262.1 chemotaxis-specific protein-glutamate methyltransferase CheB [Legionella septentrionalis]RUQ94340.1 chemotaxis-specific protein-glutamate methyltransferase CheB [Legionella septentrionalis]RUR11703.1 chemotaxis-specific protein-glutamate methyltransferase CheB [Legionella septentrionalis]RUR17391.1
MIRVLIVDDSETEVALIKKILEPESDMVIVGIARNGKEAVEAALYLKPDLITMDIQMPIMDGLDATRLIMMQQPTPIVVISSTVDDESVKSVFHILEAGALTALAKPTNVLAPNFEDTRKRIAATLRAMAEIKVMKKMCKGVPAKEPVSSITNASGKGYEVIAIGASVGGPMAVKTILSALPANYPLPIILVQHMSYGFTEGFVNWLKNHVQLQVKSPEQDEVFSKGTVYIAPEGHHLEVKRTNRGLVADLYAGRPAYGFIPSISILFKSVAKVCGPHAVGVLLTGMSYDGAEGMLEMKKTNCLTMIQGPESSIVFGMGSVAQSLDAVDIVLELNELTLYLATKIVGIHNGS